MHCHKASTFWETSMTNAIAPIAISEKHYTCLETKLRRELGKGILKTLQEQRTKVIFLNPESSLWVKRRGEEFLPIDEMFPHRRRAPCPPLLRGGGPY